MIPYIILKPIREDDKIVVGKISKGNIMRYREGSLIWIKIGGYDKVFNVRDIFKITPTPEVFNFPDNPMMMYTICIPKISKEEKEEKEKQMLIECMM